MALNRRTGSGSDLAVAQYTTLFEWHRNGQVATTSCSAVECHLRSLIKSDLVDSGVAFNLEAGTGSAFPTREVVTGEWLTLRCELPAQI